MSDDGWTETVSFFELVYVHDDDSTIARNDGPDCRRKPWALFVSDPPRVWETYRTLEAAKAAHADGEWREHMRSTP